MEEQPHLSFKIVMIMTDKCGGYVDFWLHKEISVLNLCVVQELTIYARFVSIDYFWKNTNEIKSGWLWR